MENGKRKMENRARKSSSEEFSAFCSHNSVSVICPACGTAAARAAAQFCSVCGKILTEDYEPLDRLRASYRLQGKSFGFEKIPKKKNQKPEIVNLFEENKNSASDAACAFVVYSLVPYLGILFCPLALLTGGFGVFTAYRKPYSGGARTSVYSIVLSMIIFAVQVLLWWLLYLIPELGRNI